jgi:hypothetical protein
LLQSGNPTFPVHRWWVSSELCEVEQVVFNQVKNRDTLLDLRADHLSIMQKFQKAAYSGQYHTQDMGKEFQYNYTNLDQINHKYAAFLCLDMVEYSQLLEVLAMSHKLINLLAPDGVLIIQTPNCICVRSPLISDITNLHGDNLPDVWAYLTSMDL